MMCHQPKEERLSYPCYYQRCERHQPGEGFGRLNHLREHYREYHKEDFPFRKRPPAEAQKWWESRDMVPSTWRCTKRLSKNDSGDPWMCVTCGAPYGKVQGKERKSRRRSANMVYQSSSCDSQQNYYQDDIYQDVKVHENDYPDFKQGESQECDYYYDPSNQISDDSYHRYEHHEHNIRHSTSYDASYNNNGYDGSYHVSTSSAYPALQQSWYATLDPGTSSSSSQYST